MSGTTEANIFPSITTASPISLSIEKNGTFSGVTTIYLICYSIPFSDQFDFSSFAAVFNPTEFSVIINDSSVTAQ